MPSDDDILSQLEEIDVGQIMGEEIALDEGLDLDFEDEGVPLKPKASAQAVGETELAGSEIRIGGDGRANQQGLTPSGGANPGGRPARAGQETGLAGSEIRIDGPAPSSAKPKAAVQAKAESRGPKKAAPARTEPKAAAVMPPPVPSPQAEHRQISAPLAKPKCCQDAPAAAEAPALVIVQEMVLHAKTLRIVADTVVIEPKSVSISSS